MLSVHGVASKCLRFDMTEPMIFLQKLAKVRTAVRADMVSPDNKKHSIKE